MSTSTSHRLTDEERAERRARDREYAQQAVQRLRSSEGWQQWLHTRAAFHTYSLGNQLLIAMQHPAATRVAGFRAWLKLGYCVRKGEKGVRIWAPCPPTRKQLESWEANGSKPEERPRTLFKLTAVFAQDQVQELPPPAVPAPIECPIRELEGDDLAPTLPRLIELGIEIGSTVSFAPIAGGARGFYEPDTKRIVIEQAMSTNQQVATLCHELAHALIRADRQADDPTLAYASEELIVESVAFTCVRSLGIEADGKSIPYLAAWAERADLKVIEQAAGLIDRLARRIETALHGTTAQEQLAA
jgi:antirestriction protein ArdC